MAMQAQFDETIVSQLVQLGYDRADCLDASKLVNNFKDINAVMDKVKQIQSARNAKAVQEAQQMDSKIDDHLDALYKVGLMRREKAINLFTKILTKIVENPKEDKFKSMNHEKIKNKFIGFQCPFMVDLLLFAGFEVVEFRLVLQRDNIQPILQKLDDKKKAEVARLEKERLRVIAENKQRLNTKENQKKKEIKDKILEQHQEQMELASKGVYNVKASVADRKGTGTGVNSLSY